MESEYGSDFLTISDESGKEYELEVLSSIEYNGVTYLAVTLADAEEGDDLQVNILKSVEENGEDVLCGIEDAQELEAVHSMIMDQLYEDDDTFIDDEDDEDIDID